MSKTDARPPSRCGAASNAPSTESGTPTSPSSIAAATPSATAISSASRRSASARSAIRCCGRRRRRTVRHAPTGRWADDACRPCAGSASRRSSASSTTAAVRATPSLLCPRFADGLARVRRRRRRALSVGRATGLPSTSRSTTARFSALYGLWYPHARDDRSFVVALLNQCRATVLAMQAIRRVNPTARLVQTDDISRTYGTDADGRRRRLLQRAALARLGPAVRPGRPRPSALGLPARAAAPMPAELLWFADHPCPPDVIGVELLRHQRALARPSRRALSRTRRAAARQARSSSTSSRCASSRRRRPAIALAAAGDLAALRPPDRGDRGAHRRRPRRPAALAARDLARRAERARRRRRRARRHAPGRCSARSTGTAWSANAAATTSPAVRRARARAAADRPGGADRRARRRQARRATRCCRARAGGAAPIASSASRSCRAPRSRPLAGFRPLALAATTSRRSSISGASGTLGRAFATICARRNIACRLLDRAAHGHRRPGSVAAAIARWKPWAIVNASGYVRIDEAEADVERCMRENALGPAVLAEACAGAGIRLVTFSSDQVFDGRGDTPLGRERRAGAAQRLRRAARPPPSATCWRAAPGAMVVRTSAFFGPWDRHNFVCPRPRARWRAANRSAPPTTCASRRPTCRTSSTSASIC